MDAILCNKQTETLKVEIENGIITNIGEIINKDKMPLCLQNELTLESANKWLNKRKMPLNREGLKEAKHQLGSEYYNNYQRMFALTDQYWFKINNRDSWRKYNFFTNRYDTSIGQSLFTPWNIDKEKLKPESPDMTTNGVLRKVWVQDENMTSYLIKAGSTVFHQEPLSEVLATLTLQKIEGFIPYVRYEICVNGMRICSKCRNFVDENTEFIPAQYIYNIEPRRSDKSQYEHLIMMMENYGIERPGTFIDKMMLADLVMGNSDRHLGNFGILKNVETGEMQFAPLFDFGSAFREYYKEKETEPKSRLFEEQTARVLHIYTRNAQLKALAENDDLFALIDVYPNLTAAQKDAIKTGIKERTKRFNFAEQIRGGARGR